MAFSILIVVAGVVYIAYQYERESPGALVAIAVMLAIVLIPLAAMDSIVNYVSSQNSQAAVIVAFILGLIILGLLWYFMCIAPKRYKVEVSKEYAEIVSEVEKLPKPTAEELEAVKLRHNIPIVPPNYTTYNDAALREWWKEEYNKRMKERHKILIR